MSLCKLTSKSKEGLEDYLKMKFVFHHLSSLFILYFKAVVMFIMQAENAN
jgi:hypothetical protein